MTAPVRSKSTLHLAASLALVIYALPLAAILVSAFASGLFEGGALVVASAAAISSAFSSTVRDGLGVLLVPLLTACGLRGGAVSRRQSFLRRLTCFFFGLSFGSLVLHGLIVAYEPRLTEYSPSVYDVFRNTTVLYLRESLAYLAVILGFSMPGRFPQAPGSSSRGSEV